MASSGRKIPSLAALILSVVAFSWYSYFENRQLLGEVATSWEQRVYPYLLQGSKPPILEYAEVLNRSDPPPGNVVHQRLAMVWSDRCQFCLRNRPFWEELIRSAGKENGIEVWLITLDAAEHLQPLLETVKEVGVPFTLFQAVDRRIFTLKTGAVATPTTMLLGEDLQIEAVYSGVLSHPTFLVFQSLLSRPASGAGRDSLRVRSVEPQ